ncbi:hypothetical protein C0J52_10276, partial [Blattella germanica]
PQKKKKTDASLNTFKLFSEIAFPLKTHIVNTINKHKGWLTNGILTVYHVTEVGKYLKKVSNYLGTQKFNTDTPNATTNDIDRKNIFRVSNYSKSKTSYRRFNKYFTNNVPDFIINKCAHQISSPLAEICNSSLEHGTYPNSLKIAKVNPLFKKGSKIETKFIEKIALLSGFSKIIDTIFLYIKDFIENHNLISEAQHGFLKNRSTETAIHNFVNTVTY